MTVLRRLTALAVCLLPIACANETEQEAVPPGQEMQAAQPVAPTELIAARNAFVQAWNGTDPAALSAFFVDDATATVNDSTWTGRAAIEEHWLKPHIAAVSDLTINETLTEQRGADWYSEGTYQHKYLMPDGKEPANVTGHYMTTWTQTPDGQWRLRSHHIMQDSMPAAPAAPAPTP